MALAKMFRFPVWAMPMPLTPPPFPATGLPVEEMLPRLRDALRGGTGVVLEAPPGAGKTTLVPLALLGEEWLGGKSVV